MTKYLLDTNVVSELRKRRPHRGVLAWLDKQPGETVFISAVTMGELQAGVERLRRQDSPKAREIELWVDQLDASSQMLTMDTAAFREWGRIMEGKPSELFADAMIAALARVHGLVVATRNEKDFLHFDVRLLNPFAFKA